MIRIKRVYREPRLKDGVRILVDRVWPRGMSKERARGVEWRKDLAPSTSLRKNDDYTRVGAADEEYNQALVLMKLIDELVWPRSRAAEGG